MGTLSSRPIPLPIDIEAIPVSRLFFPTGKGKGIAEDLGGTHGHIVDTKGNFVTVLQTFKNLAPIVDAVLVDSDGTGQVSHIPYTRVNWRPH